MRNLIRPYPIANVWEYFLCKKLEINILSQLQHRGDQIIGSRGLQNLEVGSMVRDAMVAFQREWRAALSGDMVRPGHGAQGATVLAPALRYSSPWPWALALAISGGMWAGIGWLIWKSV